MSEGRPLIGSPPSRPGKACFHFPACCTSQRHDASCAKPHPTNNCPYRWLLILFLFLANGSVGQNFHLGTKLRISEHQNLSLSTARGAGQQLCRTFPGGTCTDPPLTATPWGRAGPAARAGTATLSPCPRRELQAQTAPTQPSARIQSTAGGIRGFRRLIAEFTFIQSVCVRGERRGLT